MNKTGRTTIEASGATEPAGRARGDRRPRFEITDAHCHVGLLKYEPLESLDFHMRRSGVDRAVLVQYGGNYDNSYLEECIARDRKRYAAVMLVPPEDDGSTVRRLAESGFVGIRLAADSRAEGSSDSLAHWRAAAESGLTVSVRGNPRTLTDEQFLDIVRAFPQLNLVIEHLGGVSPEEAPPFSGFREFLGLAQYPQISVKVPGFGQLTTGAITGDVPPFYDMALEAFGPHRLMWGSDYPPVSSREGYANSLRYPLNYLSRLSDSEQAAIFDLNARRCWSF